MSEMNSTGGKGSRRRPGEVTQSAWDAIFTKKPQSPPCGGCGEGDPDKRCIGCLHQFAPKQ